MIMNCETGNKSYGPVLGHSQVLGFRNRHPFRLMLENFTDGAAFDPIELGDMVVRGIWIL